MRESPLCPLANVVAWQEFSAAFAASQAICSVGYGVPSWASAVRGQTEAPGAIKV